MATRRVTKTAEDPAPVRRGRPATTPEEREQELIALAYDVAEKQMRAGTASSQVITQFLKLGSSREYIEQERLRGEVLLNQAKIEALESQKKIEELYGQALDAMRSYSGQPISPHDEEFDE